MRGKAESWNNTECCWTHHSRWKSQRKTIQKIGWLIGWLVSVLFNSFFVVTGSLCHSHGSVDWVCCCFVSLFFVFFSSYFVHCDWERWWLWWIGTQRMRMCIYLLNRHKRTHMNHTYAQHIHSVTRLADEKWESKRTIHEKETTKRQRRRRRWRRLWQRW